MVGKHSLRIAIGGACLVGMDNLLWKRDTAPLMAYSLIYGIVRRDVRQWGTGDLTGWETEKNQWRRVKGFSNKIKGLCYFAVKILLNFCEITAVKKQNCSFKSEQCFVNKIKYLSVIGDTEMSKKVCNF